MHAKGLCRSLGFAYRIREDPESNGQNLIFSPIERRNCSIWLFTNSGLSTFELCPARGTHTRGMPRLYSASYTPGLERPIPATTSRLAQRESCLRGR